MKRCLATTAALAALLLAFAGTALGATAPFGFKSASAWLRNPAGAPELQAGAHPNFNTTFELTTTDNEAGEPTAVTVNPKDVEVALPPGLIGNPQAAATCSQEDFYVLVRWADCDPASQVGIATITFYYATPLTFEAPIYSLDPPPGVAAQFAFNVLGTPTYIDADVTVDGEYRLVAGAHDISQGLNIGGTSITLWGSPASPEHDLERPAKGQPVNFGEPVAGAAVERPFIGNPTSCPGAPLSAKFKADSWRAPGPPFAEATAEADPEGNPLVMSGCERVPFEATMTAQPTTSQAESPTGLDVDLELPQTELAEGLRSSDLRGAVVTLPDGMTINPASAGGLASCTAAEIGLGSDAAPSCPAGSRVGSLAVKTPLLAEELSGSVFVAQQGKNKFGSLLALYLAIENPARGVLVKLAGKVELDPATGRLVTSFEDTPQLPVSSLHLSFDGGPRAPLMTPSACGTYSTSGRFSPWSGGAPVVTTDSFRIVSGPEGGACPSGGFGPSLEAGTANPAAGSFSPLELRISRADGSQRLGSVAVRLPRGLLAKLAGVPYCPDATLAAIPSAEGTGAAELATPACPAASRVGSVAVAAGAGPSPFWAKTGSAYLAGPYKGAPLSLAIVTPAVAGPFDLGNVVVRAALRVNPETAQVTAESDPLPTILHGVPLDLRDLRVTLDRSGFVVNPTSCAAQRFEAWIGSTAGAQATPSAPYAAASCAGLGFGPKLALRLKGGTRRGAFPALTATLTAPPGQANIGRASVALPRSEFLEQAHIGTVCTRVQFAAGQCPPRSVYGWARAVSPLLADPLEGPVYLRSSSHELPDLVAALSGQIDVDLDGRIDSVHGGIRTTFEAVPDAPVSKFVLKLKGGKKSLLVNSQNLCSGTYRAKVSLRGQNGRPERLSPVLAAACPQKRR
jgi:hypothetical protein